jgi:hypothetical protein
MAFFAIADGVGCGFEVDIGKSVTQGFVLGGRSGRVKQASSDLFEFAPRPAIFKR